MTPADTNALRAAAEGARRTEWRVFASDIEEAEEHVGWAAMTLVHEHNGDDDQEEAARDAAVADAAFVRAASPDVVLALIDRAEAAERERDDALGQASAQNTTAMHFRAERDEARDDAQRLRDLRTVRDHDWDLLTARAEQAERERDEARRLHSEAEAQIACRNELRWRAMQAKSSLAQVRAQVDTLLATHDEVEKRAESAEARVKELEARLVELAACDDHGEDRMRLMAVRDATEAHLAAYDNPATDYTADDRIWHTREALRAALAASKGSG